MNTTSAPIGARRVVTTNPLWQYDYGQKLVIKGVDLPTSYEVLFGTTGDLTPVLGDANGVDIPDALLQEGNDIKAYLFLHTGEDDGEVEYVINIPVKQRPKTSEEPLTPVEQNIIEQAIAVLNLAMDKTTEYMQTTKGYRDEAEGFKDQASTSEYNASVSEDNAHASEVNALTYARRAETAESNVSVIETRVEGYIQTATELNERLEGYSEEVSEALEDISEAKTDALNGISSAKTQAVDDVTDEGARQIGLVTEEGTDQVEAVQNEGQTQVEAVQSEGTTQVNAVRTEGGTQITNIEQRGADVLSRIPYFAPIITDTANGSIASFSDGADDYPMKSVVAQIVPKQSGSGDPSPTNVRPIEGWSGVNVSQTPYPQTEKHTITGKNLYNAPNDAYEILVPCHIPANTSFVVSCASGDLGVRYYDGNKNRIDYWSSLNQATSDGRRYRVLSSNRVTEYVEFYGPTGRKNFMVEIGSTPSPYEPYGQGYSIPFKDSQGNPITVYGGNINITDGEGESPMGIVDMGTLTWLTVASSGDTYLYASLPNGYTEVNSTVTGSGYGVCEQLKVVKKAFNSLAVGEMIVNANFISNTSANAVTPIGEYADGNAFKTAMSGVMLTYRLATPTPIYCEPTEIKSLKGDNNVWADTGDTSVEYRADTKLYIDKKIGEL